MLLNIKARLLLITSLLLVSLLGLSSAQSLLAQDDAEPEPEPLLSTPNWSMTGYDLQNTSHNRNEPRLVPPLELQWTSREVDFGTTIESLVIEDDIMLVVQGTANASFGNSSVLALRLSGNSPVSATSDELWSFDLGFSGEVASTPAIADGVGYFGGQNSGLHAVNLDSGEVLWKYTAVGTLANASPKVLDDRVLVAGSLDFHSIERESGSVAWTTRINSTANATPAIFNSVVYVNSCTNNFQGFGPDSFYTLGSEFGRFLWIAFAIQNCEVLPVIDGANERLFVISNLGLNQDRKIVRAFTLAGEEEWTFSFDSNLLQDAAHLSVANGILYRFQSRQHTEFW